MKAKVKFDSAQLKGFLLHHVEKLVFGGFVVAFLLLCWSAFKLKPYPKTPDELRAKADQVNQEVARAAPPDKFTDLPSVPDFSNLGAVGPAAVDAHMYRIDPFSRPYEDRQELRKEPKFFRLEQPLAFAGYGGIAINQQGTVLQRMASSSGIGGGGGMTPEMGGGMGGAMGANMMGPGMAGPMSSGPPAGAGSGGADMAAAMQGRMQGPQTSGPPMGGPQMMGPMMGGAGRNRGRNARGRRTGNQKTAQKPDRPRPKPQVTEKIELPSAPSGSKVEGRYWVCLLGAIPYRNEFFEYQSTFRDARGYDTQRDYPRYALPEIERAEVVGDKTGEWQSVDLEEAVEDYRKWGAEYPEVAEKQFIDPHVTQPLPPLIFANHDKNKVTHPLTQLLEEKPKAVVEAPKKKKVTNLTDAAGGSRQYRQPNMTNRMGSAYASAGAAASRLPEYRLFRFFDFAVEPGKTYRYRVKLNLENPNADVQRRYLENYAFADGDIRSADWSEPSGPITVIAGNRMLAGSVTMSPGGREPTGSVLAKLFDAKEAIEVRKVFDVHRGSVLNQHEIEIGLADPNVPNKKILVMVDVETDAVVLDMFGGEKVAGGRSRVPGHFLVLDNDGALKTLTQSSDAAMYETEADEVKNQAPPKEGERAGAPAGDTPGKGFEDFNSLDSPKKPRKR